MKTRIPALAGLALAATLALAGCTSTTPEPGDESAPESTLSSNAAEFNDADVMFATMMIPHHEQAIEMSDIILTKDGVDPEVLELAQEIKDAQGPEIKLQQGWLESWGASASMHGMDHSGMGGMDGMLSPEELAELGAADGPTASRMFLEQMIAHHEGAVEMAEVEVTDGLNGEATALAQDIITAQNDEIDRMRDMLARL
ncbi:DUF305 domain-containing protein [Naumannella halotolerans]|uniref:Uncharacterized protein (DUF305 family) n=1 Tax=Naumannella halotolerans TaxID=993414 RepID=A0A4V3EMS9_9ACTN|nr:DUF305 domain-containing protein [Naumannella halotolerans]TDT31038.1 uncharacterized protein (DUF305 family) [Naumannella halotolerans]